MYYGLFMKVGRRWVRVDTTTGYTYDTAKRIFAPLIQALSGCTTELRRLPPVKQISVKDTRYARTPW